MDFSVLISVYKGDDYNHFKDAIYSIIEQSLLPTEIVLIQDGELLKEHLDIIYDFAKKYKNLNILKLEKNMGLGYALSEGLKVCKYDIVARCDSDDINDYDRFKKQIQFLNDNSDVSIVGSYIKEFVMDGNVKKYVSERVTPVSYEEILEFAKYRSPLNHQTVMFKKQHILNVGNYKELKYIEDYYLWLRVLKNGYIIRNIPENLVHVKTGDNLFKRRGGLKNTINSVKYRYLFYKENLIPFKGFLTSSIATSVVGLSPVFIRKFIYTNFLHKGVETK